MNRDMTTRKNIYMHIYNHGHFRSNPMIAVDVVGTSIHIAQVITVTVSSVNNSCD